MKNKVWLKLIFPVLMLPVACSTPETPDAYGNFEAREWVVSAGGEGKIISMAVEEGQELSANQLAGYIDTAGLSLKKRLLGSQIEAIRVSLPDIAVQMEVLRQKHKSLELERERMYKLVEAGTADRKMLDQLDDELKVTDRQIAASSSSLQKESAAILAHMEALVTERELADFALEQCAIVNPENGVVQEKFAEVHEYVTAGRPLYRLIDTREMILHAWFPGELLPRLYPGLGVDVAIDIPEGTVKHYRGTVSFVAEKPEYTPSQVQTRKNRSLLRYAVRIRVNHEGDIRPGMPAEVFLSEK